MPHLDDFYIVVPTYAGVIREHNIKMQCDHYFSALQCNSGDEAE